MGETVLAGWGAWHYWAMQIQEGRGLYQYLDLTIGADLCTRLELLSRWHVVHATERSEGAGWLGGAAADFGRRLQETSSDSWRAWGWPQVVRWRAATAQLVWCEGTGQRGRGGTS